MSDVSLNERVKLLAQRIGKECKKKLNKDEYATETAAGIAQFATLDEVIAGVETGKVIAPATLKTMLETFWGSKIPAGIILPWAGKSDRAPDGFLFLDNSIVEASDFPRLAALGTFLVKDGKMTLTAPPEGYALGFTQSAEKVMTIQDGKLPNITGTLNAYQYYYPHGESKIIGTGCFTPSYQRTETVETHLEGNSSVTEKIDASYANSLYSGTEFLLPSLLIKFIVSF